MKLAIYTPEKMFFSGEVEIVTLPGLTGSFTILDHHAAYFFFRKRKCDVQK